MRCFGDRQGPISQNGKKYQSGYFILHGSCQQLSPVNSSERLAFEQLCSLLVFRRLGGALEMPSCIIPLGEQDPMFCAANVMVFQLSVEDSAPTVFSRG